MADYVYTSNAAFVTSDGTFSGGAEILIFNADELTKEQWSIVDELPDSERIIYIQKVVDGEDTTDYEEEFHG